MYSCKIDEKYFYLGEYSKIGSISNGIDMDELPPIENQLAYFVNFKEKIITEKVIIRIYIKTVTSDTEFDTYYEFATANEDDEKVSIYITEEEYNALTYEEKENVTITSIPKVAQVEITKEEYEALSDEEKSNIDISFKTDSEGNILYEDVEKTIIIKEWAFSQEKYEQLEEERLLKEQELEAENIYLQSISPEQIRADIDYIALINNIDLGV